MAPELCQYNQGVECTNRECDRCGWNPKVSEQRIRNIKGIREAQTGPSNYSNRKKRREKSYTDQEAFEHWQHCETDAEIAAVLGVSRARIQRWRDIMELPAHLSPEQRLQYRLVNTEYGIYAVKEK